MHDTIAMGYLMVDRSPLPYGRIQATVMQISPKGFFKSITPPVVWGVICGAFSSNPDNAQQEVDSEKGAEWYDASFENNAHWKQHYSLSQYYFLWTVIADRIVRDGHAIILEIGCGSGQLAGLLRDKGITDYHGFDFSSKRIIQAEAVCPQFDFNVADAFKTDLFTTCDYTAVICTEFLEHVEHDIDVLVRIRPGTRFYGTVPNFPYLSHVRHFEDVAQVLARYEKCFQSLTVDTFLANDLGKKFYLLDGVIA